MASQSQTITKPFSRQLNGLAELQRWWPCFVKNDGTGGLTVDPVLFASSFGPKDESGDGRRNDESTMPGIRIEALNDNGTVPEGSGATAGVTPRVVMTGSGGFKPMLTLMGPGGETPAKVMLIAPSVEGTGPAPAVSTAGATTMDDANGILRAIPGGSRWSNGEAQGGSGSPTEANTAKLPTTGPYPVFMTIQELAEWIDTYRHQGLNENGKRAYLPHPLIGREVSSSARFPDVDADPRITSNNNQSTDSYWRATVFMPMMLDVNQFSSTITGAKNDNSSEVQYSTNGVTRWPGNTVDQNALDTNNVKWKTFNTPGDSVGGVNYGATQEDGVAGTGNYLSGGDATKPGFRNVDFSYDSTASVGPKYRMKMALACFLKDGDYEAGEGVLIPYTYDPSRYLGGTTTTTLYACWDGDNGYGSHLDGTYDSTGYKPHKHDRSAQIFPMFDFLQGPFAPSAQGSNWLYDVMCRDIHQGVSTANHEPRNFQTRPNPMRMEIVNVQWDNSSTAFAGQDNKLITLWLYGGATADDSNGWAVVSGNIMVGDPVYISGMGGLWGSDNAPLSTTSSKKWPARFEKGRNNQTGATAYRDFNGWWMVKSAVAYSSADGDEEGEGAIKTSQLPGVNNLDVDRFGGSDELGNWWKLEILVPWWSVSKADTNQNSTGEGVLGYLQQGRMEGFQTGMVTDVPVNWYQGTTNVKNDLTETTYAQNFRKVYSPQQNDALTVSGGGSSYSFASPNQGFGYQVGLGQSSQNCPVAGSTDDAYPGRPTITDYSLKNTDGDYTELRKVLRSIHIADGSNDTILSAPNQFNYGSGALRLPSPLGWDLTDRYNCWNGMKRTEQGEATNNTNAWRLRADIPKWDNEVYLKDRWAFRGIHTPLWSFMENSTGKHSWNNIKPPDWEFGRNRPWPGHERLGTRLAASPGLMTYDSASALAWTTPSGDYATFAEETTLYGLSEMACSPMWLDFEMIAYIPSLANRMVLIEFDSGESDSALGKHAMVYDTPNRELGLGLAPRWDGDGDALFHHPGFTNSGGVDPGPYSGFVPTTTNEATVSRFVTDDAGAHASVDNAAVYQDCAMWFNTTLGTRPGQIGTFSYQTISSNDANRFPPNYTANRAAIWMMGNPNHWADLTWTGAKEFAIPGSGGFGRMGTGFGMGGGFAYTAGFNTIRAIFNEGGMTLVVNGTVSGTDESASSPVYGMSIKSADIFSFPNRAPGAVEGLTTTPAEYAHIKDQEPKASYYLAGSFFGSSGETDAATLKAGQDVRFVSTTVAVPNASSTTSILGVTGGVNPTQFADTNEYMTSVTNPGLQASNEDLSIDRLTLRHIPSVPMVPFPVYTKTQLPVSNIAKWSKLKVNCENISAIKGMNLTATLYEPTSTVAGMSVEPSTAISGFENLEFDWIGDEGSIGLTGLPTSAITNGFVVCFEFHIPTAGQTEYHPVDWSKTPIIRDWTTQYDLKPEVDIEVIGNTYDGSTASSATVDNDFNTKVGHVITYRVTGTTTDTDRKVSDVKVDFGDGTVTDWIPIETPALSVTYDVAHVYTTRPASPYQYSITAYSRDDNGNESVVSTPAIVATVVAAQPIALLTAIPQLVRAGQAVKLDGNDSYSIDTGATISTYTFNFGDGSSAVSGASSSTNHTYAAAGEYLATLAVIDSNSQTSATAKVVVKVLPATLVVPLELNTKPHKFTRRRTASFSTTPVLDAVYPELSDLGQREDTFNLEGSFLKATANEDIAFMEELLFSGALIEIEWEAVNFSGTPTGKTFVGRMTDFQYDRRGGAHGETPYTATFVHEAGLGA